MASDLERKRICSGGRNGLLRLWDATINIWKGFNWWSRRLQVKLVNSVSHGKGDSCIYQGIVCIRSLFGSASHYVQVLYMYSVYVLIRSVFKRIDKLLLLWILEHLSDLQNFFLSKHLARWIYRGILLRMTSNYFCKFFLALKVQHLSLLLPWNIELFFFNTNVCQYVKLIQIKRHEENKHILKINSQKNMI